MLNTRSIEPVHIELDQRSEVKPSALSAKAISRACNTFTHISYINLTGTVVRVKDRYGITRSVGMRTDIDREILDPTYLNKRTLLIEIALGVTAGDIASVMYELDRNKHVSYLSRRLHERMLEVVKRNTNVTIDVIFEVSCHTIKKNGGVVYIPELDITIETGLDDGVVLGHPFDPVTRHKVGSSQLASTIANLDEDTLIVAIDAVDNSGHDTVRDKYVSIAGKIYKLMVKRDRASSLHGVRVRRRGCMEDGMLSDNFTIHEYSFTEAADVLGVSDTIDEAKCHGDTKESATRKNLVEAERLKKLENDFINEKREWEREQMEEKRLDKLRQDQFNLEKEQLSYRERIANEENTRRKRSDEEIAYERKWRQDIERERKEAAKQAAQDITDRMKIWAGIATGILAIITATVKIGEFFKKAVPTG